MHDEAFILGSPEAEQQILGSILINNEAFDQVAHLLADKDFYDRGHGRMYATMGNLINQNKPADPFTVSDALAADMIEGDVRQYLIDLRQNTASAANIAHYAEIVKKHATNRRVLDLSVRLRDLACDPGSAGAEKLNKAESLFAGLADKTTDSTMRHVSDILPRVVQKIDDNLTGGSVPGLSSGFHELDEATAGLHPGNLIYVAGRPSMGKTAFSLNIATHVALNVGKPVAVFSIEMPDDDLITRCVASVGKIDYQRIRTPERLTNEDWDRMQYAIEKLRAAPLHIDESSSITLSQMRAGIRRLARQYGDELGLVVVDYIQLMNGTTGLKRVEQLSEISRGLKLMAKEFRVPVIALSQLNRDLEKRPNKRPLMSDLRESGSLEQDGDLILFVYRDEVYHPESSDKGTAEIIIGKQRNGPLKTVRLNFTGEHVLFENYTGTYGPPSDEPPMTRYAKRGWQE